VDARGGPRARSARPLVRATLRSLRSSHRSFRPTEDPVPEKQTLKRARQDKAQGKSVSTQAGEFVREEIRHVREGKHGARSPQQAIAIGLSKARRAGVPLRPPKRGKTSERTRRSAELAYQEGQQSPRHQPSRRRARATLAALKREGQRAGSRAELARQGRRAAARRTSAERSRAAHKVKAPTTKRIRPSP
jgi:hypothetical protein